MHNIFIVCNIVEIFCRTGEYKNLNNLIIVCPCFEFLQNLRIKRKSTVSETRQLRDNLIVGVLPSKDL